MSESVLASKTARGKYLSINVYIYTKDLVFSPKYIKYCLWLQGFCFLFIQNLHTSTIRICKKVLIWWCSFTLLGLILPLCWPPGNNPLKKPWIEMAALLLGLSHSARWRTWTTHRLKILILSKIVSKQSHLKPTSPCLAEYKSLTYYSTAQVYVKQDVWPRYGRQLGLRIRTETPVLWDAWGVCVHLPSYTISDCLLKDFVILCRHEC